MSSTAQLPPVEMAVVGDVHGHFDARLDGPILRGFPIALCTGDLTPNRGRERFDEALRIARELTDLRVLTVLGNHDGPTGFTGRAYPKSYLQLDAILGELHVAGRRVDLPEHALSIVGARPLSMGGARIPFPPPGREDWTMERWGEEIVALVEGATQPRVVVLAHCGPTGLGSRRDDIYGCDFRGEEGDWGDRDLRLALDAAKERGLPVVAVVAGHMHHALSGGGTRTSAVREDGVLHVNAAVVPREGELGRAVTIVRIEGTSATSRVEWHRMDGTVADDTSPL